MRTSKAEDTTSPTWNQAGSLTINRGDRLVVSVIDKDVASDDPIDTLELPFQKPGRQTLKGKSVNSLVLDISAAPK